jgi:hypothetical protein
MSQMTNMVSIHLFPVCCELFLSCSEVSEEAVPKLYRILPKKRLCGQYVNWQKVFQNK